jgi:hypothetical protein
LLTGLQAVGQVKGWKVQQIVFVGGTCGSVHVGSFNKNMKALGVLESKWDPSRQKLVRRLHEEQDKVLRSYFAQKGGGRSEGSLTRNRTFIVWHTSSVRRVDPHFPPTNQAIPHFRRFVNDPATPPPPLGPHPGRRRHLPLPHQAREVARQRCAGRASVRGGGNGLETDASQQATPRRHLCGVCAVAAAAAPARKAALCDATARRAPLTTERPVA